MKKRNKQEEFHRRFVLAPANKAASNVVVV